jgi:hypothetical protein
MHQPILVRTLRLALLAFSIAGASACRAPAELDPVSALPKVPRIERESERPTIQVVVAEGQAADVLPSDLMAGSGGGPDKAPMERFRRTIEGAMKSTGHFAPVSEDPDYRLELSVQEVKVETKEDLGMIDWFMWKFFSRYLVASVRLGGVLYDKAGQQVGPDIEELGQYRIVSGKAFRGAQDPYLDIMGMGSSFAKTRPPAASNAMQKASVKLIRAVAEATDQENPYSEPLEKEVGE